METIDRARRAARVLKAYLTDRAARIRYGHRQRAAHVAVVQAGGRPTGYLVDWKHDTVHRLINELQQARNEFEGRHPYHALSPDDFKDVVRGVYAILDS